MHTFEPPRQSLKLKVRFRNLQIQNACNAAAPPLNAVKCGNIHKSSPALVIKSEGDRNKYATTEPKWKQNPLGKNSETGNEMRKVF